MGLFHNVLVYMVDLHLVLPALNLSFLDSGILIIGLEQFSVSPRPLGFGFLGLGLRGLVPGLDNIDITLRTCADTSSHVS